MPNFEQSIGFNSNEDAANNAIEMARNVSSDTEFQVGDLVLTDGDPRAFRIADIQGTDAFLEITQADADKINSEIGDGEDMVTPAIKTVPLRALILPSVLFDMRANNLKEIH